MWCVGPGWRAPLMPGSAVRMVTERFLEGPMNRCDVEESRNLEHLADVVVEGAQAERAPDPLETLQGDEQDAQPGAADVFEIAEIDDQGRLATVDPLQQPGLEIPSVAVVKP